MPHGIEARSSSAGMNVIAVKIPIDFSTVLPSYPLSRSRLDPYIALPVMQTFWKSSVKFAQYMPFP